VSVMAVLNALADSATLPPCEAPTTRRERGVAAGMSGL
jgi:hypothetical protein